MGKGKKKKRKTPELYDFGGTFSSLRKSIPDSPSPPPSPTDRAASAPDTKKGKKRKKKHKTGAVSTYSGRDPSELDFSNGGRGRGGDGNGRNPLLAAHLEFLSSLPPNVRRRFFSNRHIDGPTRAEVWSRQADLGEDLVNRYAWAIPNGRALSILKNFAPLVEVGSGANGYWSRMMDDAGIDIVAYDAAVEEGGQILRNEGTKNEKKKNSKAKDQTGVRKGGPEILSTREIRASGRNLLLCYPDEDDGLLTPQESDDEHGRDRPALSMGASCLEHFHGDIIIHVGELYGDTVASDQAPWGRTSSPEFQERLATEYHCLLKASIPSWLHSRDTISVWKRTETCEITFQGDGDDVDEMVEYKYIPPEEALPQDIAAPLLQRLL